MVRRNNSESDAPADADVAAQDVPAESRALMPAGNIEETAATVTTSDATTLEQVQALAYKGEALPSGWSFNNVRGYFRTDEAQ